MSGGGSTPGTCTRCRAFLVSGRKDCPFCAAEEEAATRAADQAKASAALAAAGPPSPSRRRGGSVEPIDARDRRGLDAGWLVKAGGLLAGIAVVVATFLFIPEPGSRNGSRAGALSDEIAGPLGDVARVCDGDPKPIEGAPAYRPGPGLHRIEAVTVPPGAGSAAEAPRRIPLESPWWRSPRSDAELRVDELELVACYVVKEAKWAKRCTYESEGGGGPRTVALWNTAGRVVIREAATGKEVLRKDVAAATPECLRTASPEGHNQVQHPEWQVKQVMRLVSDGSEPSWPLPRQLDALCADEVGRVMVPADRPATDVAVVVSVDGGPFAPIERSTPVALPPEIHVVPPDQAGTLLCVRVGSGKADSRLRAASLAPGTISQWLISPAAQDAQGRTVISWTGEQGLQFVLAQPRL